MTVQDIPIEKFSTAEKLELMERLWSDLSKRPDAIESPSWHKGILDERASAVEENRESFIDWNEAKMRLRARFS
jgi:putative addiction module component (TIGR02574 family)